MTVSVFPRIIRDGLVVDFDPAYNTSFNSSENRLLYSQEFNTGWSTDNCTVTANSLLAPDGTTTADTLVSTITGGNNNGYVQQVPASLPTGTVYTYSVFLKRGTSPTTLVNLFVVSPYTEVTGLITWGVNPTIAYGFGGAATSATLLANSFIDVGNGWYRVSLTMSISSGTSFACRVYIRGQGTNNVSGETVHVWGAQLERTRTASDYTPTTVSAITRSATLTNTVSALYPGTISGVVQYHPLSTGSFYFDNTAGNFISLYTLPDTFWNASSWSVSSWVRGDVLKTDNAVLGHGSAVGNGALHLGIRGAIPYFGFFGNDWAGPAIISANIWYHLVWVYDNAQKQKIIFVNGVLVAQSSLTGGVGYIGTGSNTEIGRYPWDQGYRMQGYIGRTQIYNRALGVSEVSQIYSSLAAGT